MALRIKVNETRSWAPPKDALGCDLVIHAGLAGNRQEDLWMIRDIVEFGARQGADVQLLAPLHALAAAGLPRGQALCVVTLDGWTATEAAARIVSPLEYALGNYGHGRAAWHTSNLRVLKTFMPMRGHQGLRRVPPGLEALIRAEMPLTQQSFGALE
ncbi:MAG: hypothetical protein H7841_08360 [Magnetospirillum sp. WYHS-4]